MKLNILNLSHTIICDAKDIENIYNAINEALKSNNIVELDFEGISILTFKSAEKIFGRLYNELQSCEYFKRLKFENISTDLNAIIRDGIMLSLDNKKYIKLN